MILSNYNFVLYDGGYGYWYNALTNTYFRLSENLSRKVENSLGDISELVKAAEPLYKKLCDHGFIIADNINELEIIRGRYYAAVNSKEYFLVILPTLNCNFKCWYCIQDHVPSKMNTQTLESLKKHIDYMLEVEKITSLHIEWFGGEPFMFFRQVIVPLSKYAIQQCGVYNIPFINASTTNGYYLTPSVSQSLVDLKFKQFQITLDGEKQFHDNVKFMKGCDSAFEQVLTNINHILTHHPDIHICLRINYTHKTLSKKIVPEVNQFILAENRSRVTITPRKVWQESVDKSFGSTLKDILNDFEKSGYLVSRQGMVTNFIPCYVNRKYYNAINFNGNAVKCTACDDIHKDNTKGKLLPNGRIVWADSYDEQCQQATFENERCLSCKKLPVCMGLCPREFLAGQNYCKYAVVDSVFEEELLDYLIHQYKNED